MEPVDGRRRRLLATAGLLATGGIAGCGSRNGGGDETEPTESDGPESTATDTDTAVETSEEPAETTDEIPALSSVPADALGCTHVGGQYDFTDEPYLAEGARVIASLGMRTIRIWDHRLGEEYPFDSDWPEDFDSLVDRYSHEYLRDLFEGPFETYHLTSYSNANTDQPSSNYWREGVSDEQFDREERAYYDAATHLLETYDGTGKTFVFGHWEGDWSILNSFNPSAEPSSDRVDAMIRWLNARQAGVARAREETDSDVTVLNSTSVNLVRSAMTAGDTRVVNAVVPETNVDLVAYSCYEVLDEVSRTGAVGEEAGETIRSTLDYVHEQAPTPSAYARDALGDRKNVFIGEFGRPLVEQPDVAFDLLRLLTRTSLTWGARWALYWQAFDNELQREVDGRPGNDDVRGFYLVRPDGSKADPWSYFRRVLDELGAPSETPVTLTP